jgi:hypothetical protein
MKKTNFSIRSIARVFAFLFLVIVGSIGLRIAIAAWTGPTAIPPGDNVAAPINAGATVQTKSGQLELNGGLIIHGPGTASSSLIKSVAGGLSIDANSSGVGNLFIYESGIYINGSIYDATDGTVNIGEGLEINGTLVTGTTTINGTLDMTNHKISNVLEIDPVFGINGKKYVSYMPDSIGQKVEVVGQSQLNKGELIIDLAKEKEGSDLWLFWQASDWKSVVPFVSAQDDALLYAYMDGSKLVIKLRDGKIDAKFSYRLIGTRLDHANDKDNLYSDQSVKYFIDIDALRK